MKQTDRYSAETLGKAKDIFLQEVEQRLPLCREALAAFLKEGYNPRACETAYKVVHTLKGSGQMVGLRDIADPAAEMATVLLLLKDYGIGMSDGVLLFLTERMNEINDALKSIKPKIAEPSGAASCGGNRILIVDDDRAVTKLVEESLKQYGYAVTVCHDLSAAEKQLQVEQPDLILLDIVFPADDGIEFCRRIRSNPQWDIVPVIFLTVKDKLQDKLAGFSTGADDYLCKPFKVAELVARIQAVLKRLNACRDLVLQDELTRVYNRRYLELSLKEGIVRAQRLRKNFSLAVVDVDYFKKINDQFGHLTGDETLQRLVDIMLDNLRAADIICRYGGDEFVIVMPDTAMSEAGLVLDRLRRIIAQEPLELPNNHVKIPLTISAGVAAFSPGTSLGDFLKMADQALYEAKRRGRNQVALFPEVQ